MHYTSMGYLVSFKTMILFMTIKNNIAGRIDMGYIFEGPDNFDQLSDNSSQIESKHGVFQHIKYRAMFFMRVLLLRIMKVPRLSKRHNITFVCDQQTSLKLHKQK